MDKDHKILLDALGFDPTDLDTGRAYRIQTRSRVLDDADPRARRPRSGRPRGPLLPSRQQEPEVKDNVLDLLIYLFENYMSADDEPRPDRDVLKLELDKAGFAEPDIERALEWLDGLSGEQLGKVAEATARAVRVFSSQELLRLDTDVRGYLMYLENVRILSGTQRELVIDRLMALEADEIDIEQVKWVVLMVLFSQPGQESAYAQMEDLVFEERSDALH
jgi:Smg protein